MKTLTEIGKEQNTDKATDHGFTDKYDSVLSHLREKEINILEVGIYGGASLKMWKEYFQKGTVYGVDIEDKRFLEEDRIHIEQADQVNLEVIKNVFNGKDFDIIIDDGGHRMDQQQISLVGLLPRLKSGGIYIIEDLHTSFMQDYWGNYNHPKDNSMLRLLMEIATKRFTDMKYYINFDQIKSIQQQINTIEVFSNNFINERHNSLTAIIHKN